MIITTTRHGRTARDTRYLLAHLSKENGQRSRVVHVAAPTATAAGALDYMSALRDGSRATVAFHHLSLSPSAPLTDEQRDEAVSRILTALGAGDHAHVVWEHAEKARRGRKVDTHYHVVVAHVGPSGKALDDGRSFVRLEAVARSLEADFGHDLTPGRRTAAVVSELERIGCPDVAARLLGEAPPEPPASAMSSRQRARAERHGFSLPDVRETVRQAWEQSDNSAALRAALAEQGLGIIPGDKSGVWIVTTADGQTLGALDRLSGERRKIVAARMQQKEIPHDTASNASFESDLRPSPAGPGSGPVPDPAPSAVGAGAAGRGQPSGGSHGASKGHSTSAGKDTPGDRVPDRRAAGTAIAIVTLASAARSSEVRARACRLRKLYRFRARDVLDARRLARIDLDEILHRALALGRRAEALALRLRPEEDERAVLLRRLRTAATRPAAAVDQSETMDRELPVYRPRF